MNHTFQSKWLALTTIFVVGTHASAAQMDKDVHARGKIVSLQAAAGCGIIKFGSPVTYQIMSGDRDLLGKQVVVVVECVEMPELSGKIPQFSVGDIHDLVLTRRNVHKIENSSPIDSQWFYLRSAKVAK
ncbi:hypothetical protein [Undibacterium sp. Ji22W]|uniref:hypothetical protein n=1 Tax=Undibacterium sp. Ji22W TaxID=3413038 RepID=UPI003BEF7E54